MPKYVVEIPVFKLFRASSYSQLIDTGSTKEYSEKELARLLYNALFSDGIARNIYPELNPKDIKVKKIADIGPSLRPIARPIAADGSNISLK